MACHYKKQSHTSTTSLNTNKPFPSDDLTEALVELLKAKSLVQILVRAPISLIVCVLIVARWPEKSAKFILGLLKNAEANAQVAPLQGES